jgi:hypothetical protein
MKKVFTFLIFVCAGALASGQNLGVSAAYYLHTSSSPTQTCSATSYNGVFAIDEALNLYQCSNNNVGATYTWNTISSSGASSTGVIHTGTGAPSEGTPSTITFVQGASNTEGPLTLAYGSSVTAGHLLIVWEVGESGLVDSIQPTDTVGTNYQFVQYLSGGTTVNGALWVGLAGGSGANTVTWAGSGVTNGGLGIAEFSGASAFTDVIGTPQFGAANPSVSITPTSSGDLLLGLGAWIWTNGVGLTFTAGSGMTIGTSTSPTGGDFNPLAVEYLAGGTTSSTAVAISQTGNSGGASAFTAVALYAVHTGSVGSDGDFYLDTASGILYGPRTSGLYFPATIVPPQIPPGVVLTGTPSAGQMPTATGPHAATWQTPSPPPSGYYGNATATASSGNNYVTLGSTPVAGSLSIFVNGDILPPTAWSVSGANATLGTPLSSADVVVATWNTTNSTPGSITLSSFGTSPSYVGGCNNGAGGGSSATVSCSGPTLTAGDVVAVFCRSSGNSATFTVADGTNTYTAGPFNSSSSPSISDAILYSIGVASGSPTFTCTANSPQSFLDIVVVQYHPGTLSTVDAAPTGNIVTGNTVWTSSSFSTSTSTGLIIACGDPNFASGSLTAGLIGSTTATMRQTSSNGPGCEDTIPGSSQSSITAAMSSGSSGNWGGTVLALK